MPAIRSNSAGRSMSLIGIVVLSQMLTILEPAYEVPEAELFVQAQRFDRCCFEHHSLYQRYAFFDEPQVKLEVTKAGLPSVRYDMLAAHRSRKMASPTISNTRAADLSREVASRRLALKTCSLHCAT